MSIKIRGYDAFAFEAGGERVFHPGLKRRPHQIHSPQKYHNPRTGNVSSGAAAREGRIQTLGGVDQIISNAVTKTLIAHAPSTGSSRAEEVAVSPDGARLADAILLQLMKATDATAGTVTATLTPNLTVHNGILAELGCAGMPNFLV